MTANRKPPTLFVLLRKLSPVERQEFGERRRALKKDAEERLIEGSEGEWRLEYWKGKKKAGELKI